MRTERILHPQLARAVAELGHTDIAMVVDAG
jgi:D-ribose pyranose/furanose isomerase RbsD